jgi:hypothetical protein
VSLLLVAFLSASLGSSILRAQATAQISGTVSDASGLAVPAAEVKATQTATGAVRTVTTGADGGYVFSNLPIGPYQLEVTKEGFATYTQSGIALQVASNPTLDISLKVGAVSERVQVEATAVQVETQATGVGQVIDNQRVLELPLNARNSQQLIILAGAAVAGGTQSTNRGYPVNLISVGGGLNNGLTYVLDGGTHNEPYINANMPLPFPDALQEFKVDTSSVPAQYGQHSAGAVEAVTKSGTNEFHGDAFEFIRNGDLDARNTFAATVDQLKRNQFGGVVGGPVKKNKLFFFFGDQFTRTRSVPTTVIDTIPSQQALSGDWTAITSPACNGGRQINLKAPFINNTISPSLYSPQAVNLMKHFPAVTNPCGQDVFGRVNNSNEQFIVSRIDYQQSSKNLVFGRYMLARLDQIGDYNGTDPLSASAPNYTRRAHSLVLGDTYLISSSMVSSFRATLLRTVNAKNVQDFFNFSDLGVQNVYYPANYAKIAEITDSGDFTLFKATLTPGNTNSTDWQLAEDLSMTHGAHQISFGVDYIQAGLNYLSGTQAPGAFTFTATNTGSALGDLMLGDASKWTQSQLVGWYPRQRYFAGYVQDTWKATSHLTVIAGLRWEPYLSPYTKYIQSGVFSNQWYTEGLHSTVFPNAPVGVLFSGDPGVSLGNSLDTNSWAHFGPRLGLAWDPKGDGRMVIRAAAGKYFDYTHLDTYGDLQNSPPTGGRVALTGVNFGNPWAGTAGSQFPLAFGPNAIFVPAATYLTVEPGIKHAYIEQWNVSIQKQFGQAWLASASYMGNLGVHENQGHEGNPAIYIPGNCVAGQYGLTAPGPCSTVSNENNRRLLSIENPAQGAYFSNIEAVDSNATRSYNGMILSLQRRAARGVSVLANYTWSHCIDFQNTTNTNTVQAWQLSQLSHDRGDCELDRRHLFNLSTVYLTPRFSNPTLRLLATDWQISGIVTIQSGPSMIILSGLDQALTGTTDQFPNLVLNNPFTANPGTGTRTWLNPAAFAQPALGTYGNLSPGNIHGPGLFDIDMALSRIFRVKEKVSFEIRAEAFNLLNHVNPGDPNNTGTIPGGVDVTLTDGNFGKIVSALDPRIMQVAAKIVF